MAKMIWTLLILPITLLLLGFPIFLILLVASATTMVLTMNIPLLALHQYLFASVNAYALLALPFFIFAGELMDRGGIAKRLVNLVSASMGRVPAKIPITAIFSGAVFGAITGVGAAAVATVGKVVLPRLREDGYDDGYSSGLIVSVGAVGVILPPSIPMIVYAASADESIPRLYAAGIFPGLLIVGMLIIYAIWQSFNSDHKSGKQKLNERFSLSIFWHALKNGIWAAGVPIVILGGIYGGVFSPTEAAGVACMYAFLVSFFIVKELTWTGLYNAAQNTVFFTAQIVLVIACAGVFSWLITVNQIPAIMVEWIVSMALPGWVLLLVLNLLLLIVGCLIDPISAILLLTPLMLPLIQAVGVDPVHFGIVVTMNLAIGLFTPPFGINIFVVQSLFKIDLRTIYGGLGPFIAIYIIALLLVTFIPQISLSGVALLMGK